MLGIPGYKGKPVLKGDRGDPQIRPVLAQAELLQFGFEVFANPGSSLVERQLSLAQLQESGNSLS
jgi:hypothetical protein